MNVIAPKLEYSGEVWEGNAKLVKQLETAQMTAAKKYQDAQVRRVLQYKGQKWECAHLKQRDVRKLKWQYKVNNMPKKRLTATADRAVWEKVTKERAGIRWDSVVERVWKDIGCNQGEMMSIDKFAGQDRSKRKDRNKGKASAKKQGERGGTLGDLREVKRRNRN